MEAELVAHPIMLDFRLLIFLQGLLTFFFTVGGVYATIRFGLKRLNEKQIELAARIDGVETKHKSAKAEAQVEMKSMRSESTKNREAVRKHMDTALKSVESAISQRLDGQEQFFRQVLFRDDGVTNYPTRGECEQCRITCQTRLDGRLETIQRAIESGDRRREASKDDIVKMFVELKAELARLYGSVEEHHSAGGGKK